jgi:uncharacterized protein YneF (UPF0154 family)
MIIYAILGVFIGLFLGSWGGFLLARRMYQSCDTDFHIEMPPVSEETDEMTDAEQDEKRRKEIEAQNKALEGLINVMYYDGKPQSKGGEEE